MYFWLYVRVCMWMVHVHGTTKASWVTCTHCEATVHQYRSYKIKASCCRTTHNAYACNQILRTILSMCRGTVHVIIVENHQNLWRWFCQLLLQNNLYIKNLYPFVDHKRQSYYNYWSLQLWKFESNLFDVHAFNLLYMCTREKLQSLLCCWVLPAALFVPNQLFVLACSGRRLWIPL